MSINKIPMWGIAVFSAVCANSALLADIGDVKLKGRLGDVLERMIEGHVVGTDVDYITAPFFEIITDAVPFLSVRSAFLYVSKYFSTASSIPTAGMFS